MIKRLLGALAAACALLYAGVALAQATGPSMTAPLGTSVPGYGHCGGRFNDTCQPDVGTVLTDGAVNRSTTITAGGTPQDLMPANTHRVGWEVQNQSTDNCYIRSKGSAGTTTATADQNSILIYPGVIYSPPHITSYALSIICPTTNDAIYAREW